MLSKLILTGVFTLLATPNAISGQTPTDAKLLIEGVHDARRRIKSGRFELAIRRHWSEASSSRGYTREARFVIFLSPDAIRVRHIETTANIFLDKLPPEMKGDPGNTRDPAVADRLRELGALVDMETTDNALFLSDTAYRFVVEGGVLRVFDPAPLRVRFRYPDPRLVGIASDPEDRRSIGLSVGPDEGPPFADVTPADAAEGVRVVQREQQRGARYGIERIWIDTNKDFSIIRREGRSKAPDVQRLEVMKTTLQQLPNGYWYPARVERSVEKNGELERSSTIEVTHAEINIDIDEHEFTIAAMGVPRGATVFDLRTEGAVGHWTGSKIVMDDVSGTPVADLVGRVSGGWTRWLWASAGVAAVGAALAYWRRRRAGATA